MNPLSASVILTLLLAGCASHSTSHIDDSQLVGMTIADAMKTNGLEADTARIIDEPPGVPRGVSGETAGGKAVELYIRRGAIPMNVDRSWEVSAFFDQNVIGVARMTESGWAVSGEVMFIRAQTANKNNKKAKSEMATPRKPSD